METSTRSTRICAALGGLACLALSTCTDTSTTGTNATGDLAIRARVVAPTAKCLADHQTTWDSLVVCAILSADTVRSASAVGPADAVVADTLTGLPAEDNVVVSVATVNADGVEIHSAPSQTIDLTAGGLVELSFWLNPVGTSVYVELTDVPTSVDSVHACFETAEDAFCAAAPRAARVTALAIDNVPDGASGTLTVAGVGPDGDTLYVSTLALTVYADRAETVWAQFTESPGSVALNISLTAPSPTLVAASMDGSSSTGTESGALVISEIMYMANGSEYIELHNPSVRDTTFDSLAIEIDGARRWLCAVTVGAGGYYVVGRADSVWVDTVLSFLDLSSTSGNWLTVRDARLDIIDWVGYAVKSNELEWPYIPSARASIELDSVCADPTWNNYGGHWREATAVVEGSADLKGTPGGPGS